MVGEALEWSRKAQKDILDEPRKMKWGEFAKTLRTHSWKGRKPIYRKAKEGPKERPTMNAVKDEQIGSVVSDPKGVREAVLKASLLTAPTRYQCQMSCIRLWTPSVWMGLAGLQDRGL